MRINEAFAQRFFEKRNPIGLHITAIAYDANGLSGRGSSGTPARRVSMCRRPRYFVAVMQAPAPPSSVRPCWFHHDGNGVRGVSRPRTIHEVIRAADVGRVDREDAWRR